MGLKCLLGCFTMTQLCSIYCQYGAMQYSFSMITVLTATDRQRRKAKRKFLGQRNNIGWIKTNIQTETKSPDTKYLLFTVSW